MNTCVHCGIGFSKWGDYNEHLQEAHKMTSYGTVLIKPVNVSGRSKAQIVKEAEASWLAPLIITTSNEQEHLNSCKCNVCFQKALDRLVEASGRALEGPLEA